MTDEFRTARSDSIIVPYQNIRSASIMLENPHGIFFRDAAVCRVKALPKTFLNALVVFRQDVKHQIAFPGHFQNPAHRHVSLSGRKRRHPRRGQAIRAFLLARAYVLAAPALRLERRYLYRQSVIAVWLLCRRSAIAGRLLTLRAGR